MHVLRMWEKVKQTETTLFYNKHTSWNKSALSSKETLKYTTINTIQPWNANCVNTHKQQNAYFCVDQSKNRDWNFWQSANLSNFVLWGKEMLVVNHLNFKVFTSAANWFETCFCKKFVEFKQYKTCKYT